MGGGVLRSGVYRVEAGGTPLFIRRVHGQRERRSNLYFDAKLRIRCDYQGDAEIAGGCGDDQCVVTLLREYNLCQRWLQAIARSIPIKPV